MATRPVKAWKTVELLSYFGIEPGVAEWRGRHRRNQGPQAYTKFSKLPPERHWDQWDEVKRVYETRTRQWRREVAEQQPDGADAAKMAEANARHNADEAVLKELQRRFHELGVETGFDEQLS